MRTLVSRREFVAMSVGAGAALALTPELLRAFQPSGGRRQAVTSLSSGGRLIQRAIPSSGEMLPVVGLQFGNPPPPDHAALKEVLKTLLEHGGRFVDAVHQSAEAEEVTARIATELGMQDKIFWASRAAPAGPPQPGPTDAAAKAQIERSLAGFKVARIDLVLMNPMADPGHLAALKEMKKAGRVRYIGMQVIDDRQYPKLETVMRTEPLDFIGIDYSIANRGAEQTILPLAQERKMGVVAYFPFDAGGLFQRAGTTPLPGWAADFDARTWAQFFIKYVLSHPAITVVRTGTSQAKHMLDNIAGGSGRLPNEATRKRMAELVDSWPLAGAAGTTASEGPAAVTGAILDRYAGEYKIAAGAITVSRVGSALHLKVGDNQEAPLVARSETRFSDPWGAVVEFQLDAAGTVTGLVLQQGQVKMQASRIR